MSHLQDWNQAIDKALQLFFLAEDFSKVARPNTEQLKNNDVNDRANFPIHLQAEQPIAQMGLELAISGEIFFANQPNDTHFSCNIPVSIRQPKWLLNIIYQHSSNELFEIPNNTIQGTITIDFEEEDHVYEGMMLGDVPNFRLDPLLASALRQTAITDAKELSDFNQWVNFIVDGYRSGKNDMDDYLTCLAAAKLIVTHASNLGEPQFQKTFTLCTLSESFAPLKNKFPEAFH